MSHPAAPPATDPAIRTGPTTYVTLSGKEGFFKIERKGEETRTSSKMKGRAVELIFEWDPEGNPDHDIPPRWEVSLELQDTYFGEDPVGTVILQIGAPVSVSTLIERIWPANPGDWVFLAPVKGRRTSFINAFVAIGGEWVETREQLTQGGSMERYSQSVVLAWRHPLLNRGKSDPYDVDDPTRVCPRGKAFTPPPLKGTEGVAPAASTAAAQTTPAQPASQAVQPHGATPVQTSAPTQAQVTQAGMAAQAPANAGVPAQMPTVYGWALLRVPFDTHWTQARTDGQLGVLGERMAKRNVHPSASGLLLGAIAGSLGRAPTQSQSLAAYGVLNDFLGNASDDQLNALLVSAGIAPAGAVPPSPDEYDPFANE
ncbi:MAG: hypothetical protein ACO1SV_27545 [Fimbriimonas sp.]